MFISLKSNNHKKYLVVKIGTDKDPNIETFNIPKKNLNEIDEKIIENIDCIKTISIPKAGLSNRVRVLDITATDEQVNYLLEKHDKFIYGLYGSNKKYLKLKQEVQKYKEAVEYFENNLFSKLLNNCESDNISAANETATIIYLYKKIYGEAKYNELLNMAHNISDFTYLMYTANFDIDSMMIIYLINHNIVPRYILKKRESKFQPDPAYIDVVKKQKYYSSSINREVEKMKKQGYSIIKIIEILSSLNNNANVINEFTTREKLIAENNERTAALRKKYK